MIKYFLILLLISNYAFSQSAFDALGESTVVTVYEEDAIEDDNTSVICKDKDQSSMPLSFFMRLFDDPNKDLDFSNYDPQTGKLVIEGGKWAANCKDMLNISLTSPTSSDENYYLEIKFKKNSTICNDDMSECNYTVIEKPDINSAKEESKSVKLAPTLDGFIECLKVTGVLKEKSGGGFEKVEGKRVKREFKEEKSNVKKSGYLYFKSHGPRAQVYGPMYGKIKNDTNKCEYIEKPSKYGHRFSSTSEMKKNKNLLVFKKVCKSTDYNEMLKHLSSIGEFRDELLAITSNLLKKEVKKLARDINDAKKVEDFDELDLDVIKDFHTYVIKPLIKKIENKYDQLVEMEKGKERDKVYKELKELRKELSRYKNKPYLQDEHYKKLIKAGQFVPAKALYLTHKTIKEFSKVGSRMKGKIYTPEKAKAVVDAAYASYEEKEEQSIKDYKILNCEEDGSSKSYYMAAKNRMLMIQLRNKAYQKSEQNIRTSINKKCYKYWIDTNSCIRQCMFALKELAEKKQKLNTEDQAKAAEYTAEAKRLRKLERKAKKKCDDEASADDVDDLDKSSIYPKEYNFTWENESPSSSSVNYNWSNNYWDKMNFNNNNQLSGNQNYNNLFGLNYNTNFQAPNFTFGANSNFGNSWQQSPFGTPWGGTNTWGNSWGNQTNPWGSPWGNQNTNNGFNFNWSGGTNGAAW